jgi:hypothetical protein
MNDSDPAYHEYADLKAAAETDANPAVARLRDDAAKLVHVESAVIATRLLASASGLAKTCTRAYKKRCYCIYCTKNTNTTRSFYKGRVFLPTQGREHRPGFQVHIVQVSAQCAGVLRTSCGAPPCQGEQGQHAGRADRRTRRASTTMQGKNTRKEEPPQESQQGEEQEPCLPDHGVNGIRYWHSLRDTPNVVTFTCEKLIALL